MPASVDLYTAPSQRKVEVIQVTSEATGHPAEMAFDWNPDTYWAPTSTAVNGIRIDLNNNLQDLIEALIDRDFSSAVGTNWSQQTMFAFAIAAGELHIAANGTGQYCRLDATGIGSGGFKIGRRYRVTYDYVQNISGFHFQQEPSGGIIGTCVAGTGQTIEFTASRDSTIMLIVSDTSSADGKFDNMSIRDITNEDDWQVDGLGLFMRNYDTDFASEAVELSYSLDGTNFVVIDAWNLMTYGAVGDPLKIYPVISEIPHRWWRVTFGGTITQIVNIAQIILYKKLTVSRGNEFPELPSIGYADKYVRGSGGVSYQRRMNYNASRRFPRSWHFTNQADFEALRDLVIDCLGSAMPLILADTSERHLVEILGGDFNQSQVGHADYMPTIVFQSLPYNADGEGY